MPRRRRRDPARDRRGFALLEVLVAFMIAALALGGLVSAALQGLRATASAGHVEEALARARSHLAGIAPLLPGTAAGDDGGGYSWRTRVSLLATTPLGGGAATEGGALLGLYAVSVTVSWQAGRRERSVSLASERVAPAPPASP